MSAGRPPKPTNLKLLEGNKGKRALNRGEPDPDYLDNLEPSAWLPDDAKAVWRELAFKLRKAKVLTVLDVQMLEMVCVHVAQWRKATMAVRGQLVQKRKKDKDGKTINQDVMNPWLIVQSMNFKQASAMLREFGMSPAARSRVLIDPQLGLFGAEGEADKASGYFTR